MLTVDPVCGAALLCMLYDSLISFQIVSYPAVHEWSLLSRATEALIQQSYFRKRLISLRLKHGLPPQPTTG